MPRFFIYNAVLNPAIQGKQCLFSVFPIHILGRLQPTKPERNEQALYSPELYSSWTKPCRNGLPCLLLPNGAFESIHKVYTHCLQSVLIMSCLLNCRPWIILMNVNGATMANFYLATIAFPIIAEQSPRPPTYSAICQVKCSLHIEAGASRRRVCAATNRKVILSKYELAMIVLLAFCWPEDVTSARCTRTTPRFQLIKHAILLFKSVYFCSANVFNCRFHIKVN